MSSLKMTFSLTSLIFLIALGLVFVPTAVMAHDATQSATTPPIPSHNHPVRVLIPAVTADAANNIAAAAEVPIHGHHPMVTSIALKAGDKVRDKMVEVGAAPNAATANLDPNQFVLVVTFDRPVVDPATATTADTDGTVGVSATEALAILAAADISFSVRNKNRAPLATQANISFAPASQDAITVVDDVSNTFEVVVTATGEAVPTGVAADDNETVILIVQIPNGAVFSAQQTLDLPNAVGTVDVPGGASSASSLYEFTLVKELPTVPMAPTAPENLEAVVDPEEVTVELRWDEEDGTEYEYSSDGTNWNDAESPQEVMGLTANEEVTLMVRVKAMAPDDLVGVAASITVTIDTMPPTASITGEPNDEMTAAVFTITFSEELATAGSGALKVVDFEITNESATTDSMLTGPTANDDDEMVVYMLTVTPMNIADPVTVMLRAGTVDDLADPPNSNESGSNTSSVTVQADSTPPTVEVTVADMLNSDGKAVFTLTFDEPLATMGAGALTLAQDIVVTNGTDAALGMPTTNAAGEEAYELTATPTDREQPVMVEIDARSGIEDEYGNALDVEDTENNMLSATFDDRRPMATVTAPDEAESNGDLEFTLDFSEEIDESTLQPGTVGDDNVEAIAAPEQSPTDPTVYTVLVTPEDPMEPTRVEIADVQDLAGNQLVAEAADTYTPPGVDPGVPDPTIRGPAELHCEDGGTITVTFDEALKAGEALEVGDIELIDSPGWEITNFSAANGTFDLMPKSDRSWIGTTKVNVKVKAGVVVDADDQDNTAADMDFTVGPVLTIPRGGYIVVNRDGSTLSSHLFDNRTNVVYHVGDPDVGSRAVSVQVWDCMPDLGVRFGRTNYNYDRGGTLVVDSGGGLIVKQSAAHTADSSVANSGTIVAGTVGISEIMWAIDRSENFGDDRNLLHAKEQWIELHNLNNFDVKVTLFDLIRDEAYSNTSYGELDRMTNYNLPQYHGNWPIRDAGRGQDGDSDYGEDFVAMQRGPASLAKNYLHGDFDGRNGGKWTAATAVYLTRRADDSIISSGRIDPNNFRYDFIGTPGRTNDIATRDPAGTTVIPRSPFIINEVANRSNSNRIYEWIEIKATGDGESNLRNYIITTVTGVGTETVLYTFPNSDIKVNKDDLILVVASDPEDDGEHPLAVGKDFFGGNDQVRGIGLDVANSGIEPANYIIAKSSDRLYTEGMPDNGNFVLFLRRPEAHDKTNATAKLKTHEWVIDIGGYHPNLGNPNVAPDYSALWPLKGFPAPNLTHNRFDADQVHRRQNATIDGTKTTDGNKGDKTAFGNAAYSGIGYRRHATNSAAHGGTPGYDDIRKNLYADVKKGKVRISEIMFEQGDGRTPLPQWIEIHNTSPTEAVNLHADDGWRLAIENYDDGDMPIGRISGTLNFKSSEVQTLLPLQTVLVASTRARNAGSASINASVVFIPTRVFSVYADARDQLAMKRATDPILSETGFHIELVDGKGNFVDAAGNLPVDASGALIKGRGRSVATIAWEWSTVEGVSEDNGFRSSLVRRSITKMDPTRLGVEAAGWISASSTNYRRYVDTWYGDEDDVGSPGITVGGVLPVSLSKFRPERLKDTGEVVVRWITESETNNAGFNILRSETRDGQFTKINTSLIAGQGTTSERTTYEWKDSTAKPNVVYYYQIQDVSLDGKVDTLRMSRLKGNVTAAGKATTTWGELKALQ